MDAKIIIETISEQQILEILAEYGLTPVKEKDNEFWFQTLCHGGNSPKLCMFRDTKDFYCYTNCGKMSFLTLLMKISNCSFTDTLNYVSSKVLRHGFANNINDYKRASEDIRYLEKKRAAMEKTIYVAPDFKEYDSQILNYFDSTTFYSGWYDEGISIDSMEKYNISWYEFEKYIIIPHYDKQGKLIGIRRRSLKEEDSKNKYMPLFINQIEYGHSLGLNLYGIDKNKAAIERFKTACIVESEKSVLLGDTYFGDDNFTVATCGFNISEAQVALLLSLGVERVVLGFDKDVDEIACLQLPEEHPDRQNYERFCKRLYSLCTKLISRFSVSVLWDTDGLLDLKDSPYDKGIETLEKLWKNKIVIDGSLCC